jgi:hypothetical protein
MERYLLMVECGGKGAEQAPRSSAIANDNLTREQELFEKCLERELAAEALSEDN